MDPVSTNESPLRFNLLGDLEIRHAGDLIGPGTAGAQSLLVALLLRPEGYPDSIQLIKAIWGEQATKPDTLYKYASQARRIIEPYGLTIDHTSRMRYRLEVPESTVDAHRFTHLVTTADALAITEPEESTRRRREAVALWRGPLAVPDLRLPGIRRLAHHLETLRLDAEERLVTADLDIGGVPDQFLGHLRDLYAAHPAHIGIAATLIRALGAAGHAAEATDLYRRATQRHGYRVPPRLQQAHPRRVPAPGSGSPTASGGWPVPAQLPPGTQTFIGRDEELAHLTGRRDPGARRAISAVSGMPGVGKTALVLRAAHQLTDEGRYPDGTLYLDLRGLSDDAQLSPAEALDALLHGIGVPGSNIPPETDARAALYRTVVARRTMLIVLDNARDEAQIRPLLPGTSSSHVLLTSRRSLAGLDDADQIRLDVLPVPESVRLFRVAVAPRAPGDDETVEHVVQLCGLLPLAIRIVGARLRTTRALTIERLLTQLKTERNRLHVLEDGERSVAAAIAMSMGHLTPQQRQAFAALGIHPGSEYESYATAALLGISRDEAQYLLDALERANLLDQPTLGRYTFHDLVRAYAGNVAGALPEHAVAIVGLYDFNARAAGAAMDVVYPYEIYCRPRSPWGPTVGPDHPPPAALPDLTTKETARAWLTTELDNLLASAHDAADRGEPRHAIYLSATLHRHLRMLGRYAEALALHQRALKLARLIRDVRGELDALVTYGYVLRFAGQYGPADACLTEALATGRRTGSTFHELRAATGLGQIRYAEAAHDEGARWFGSALDMAKERGDRIGAVDALTGLGRARYAQGRYSEAARACEGALTISTREGYDSGELEALTGQAYVTYGLGQFDLAGERFENVRRSAHDTGSIVYELNALIGLASVNRLQGDLDAAMVCYNDVQAMSRAIGDLYGELNALSGLAELHRMRGSFSEAGACFTRVLVSSHEAGLRNFELEANLGLGRTYRSEGDARRSLAADQQALTLATTLGQQQDEVRALDGMAHAHRALGEAEFARRAWTLALSMFGDLGLTSIEHVDAADIEEQLRTLPGEPGL